jgi:hypothetical protein
VTNDGAHIYTRLDGPFCLGTKMFIHGGFTISSSMMLSNFGGPEPQIGGQFECGVPFKVLLCYVLGVW